MENISNKKNTQEQIDVLENQKLEAQLTYDGGMEEKLEQQIQALKQQLESTREQVITTPEYQLNQIIELGGTEEELQERVKEIDGEIEKFRSQEKIEGEPIKLSIKLQDFNNMCFSQGKLEEYKNISEKYTAIYTGLKMITSSENQFKQRYEGTEYEWILDGQSIKFSELNEKIFFFEKILKKERFNVEENFGNEIMVTKLACPPDGEEYNIKKGQDNYFGMGHSYKLEYNKNGTLKTPIKFLELYDIESVDLASYSPSFDAGEISISGRSMPPEVLVGAISRIAQEAQVDIGEGMTVGDILNHAKGRIESYRKAVLSGDNTVLKDIESAQTLRLERFVLEKIQSHLELVALKVLTIKI